MSINVDLDTGLGRVRGNKKLYNRMLGMFVDSVEFEKFENALSAKDDDLAAQVIHGVKGMAGNLALTQVFENSTELMQEFRDFGKANEDTLLKYRQSLKETFQEIEVLQEKFNQELEK